MSTCSRTTCQSFPNVHLNKTYSTGRNARNRISLKTDAWYKATPLVYNTLDAKLKTILQLGGLKTENRSNHSLRASTIT